jgi:hypothetical protein
MNYIEPPLGFECYLNGWGRVALKQDQTTSELREEAKIPVLHFQPQELPALIEELKRVIADVVIPDLRSQNEENEALIHLLQDYLPQERPAKKKGPPAAG